MKMAQLPNIQPILSLNSPNPQYLPLQFVENGQTIELHGKFIQLYDYGKNSARFLHLDDSYRQIVAFSVDPSRRLLAVCYYADYQYRVHVFYLKTLFKVAQLNVYDSLYLPKQIIGLAVSADGKWVLLQAAQPDFIIAAWQLPGSVYDYMQNPAERFSPVIYLKCLLSYKVYHEISGIFFSKTIADNFTVYGPGIYIDFHINDNAIRVYAPINVKKILNKFEFIFQDKEYSFLVVPETNEILVLNYQSLVSFVPGDVVISFRNAVRTTMKQEPKYRLIRNHPDSMIKKDDYERAGKCVVIDRKLLVVATTRSRLLVFKIEKLDASHNEALQKQQAPCKTVNQMLINVCEVVLVMSVMLPDDSPIISLDLSGRGHVLVQYQNGQAYICTKLTPGYVEATIYASIKVQNQTEDDVRLFHNLVVLNAFDSIAKLKELIKDPFRLKPAQDELYQLNPMRQTNKLSVLGAEDLDALDKELALEPEFWPGFLFAPRTSNVFTPWLQACSSVLANVDQVLVNSKVFKPYIQFQGALTGRPFYTSTSAAITAVSASDVAGLLVYGDEKGWIKAYSLPKAQPVCAFYFRMPKRNRIITKEEEMDDDEGTPNANPTTQRSQLTVTTTRALSARNGPQGEEKEPIQLPDEYDFSSRDYSILSLYLHCSGLYLLAGVHCADPKFKNFVDCLAIFYIVQNELEIATIIEVESEIIYTAADQNGNYIYVLTKSFVTVLSFFELRFIYRVDLRLRTKFINPVFQGLVTQENAYKMAYINQQLQDSTLPTHMEVHDDCELVIVSFQDGDVAAYNCFQNTIEFKYLLSNAAISKVGQFVRTFKIVSRAEMTDAQLRDVQKYQDSPYQYIPLLATMNDGSVFEVSIEGPTRSLFLSGVGPSNAKITQCCLLCSYNTMEAYSVEIQEQSDILASSMAQTVYRYSNYAKRSTEYCLMASDKGTLYIVQLSNPSVTPFTQHYHLSQIKFLSIVCDCYVATVSADNYVIFSKLQFAQLTNQPRLYPQSVVAQTQVLRSKMTYNALDLLLFELLTKLFLLREESAKSLEKVKTDCDSLVYQEYNNFVLTKQEVYTALQKYLTENQLLETRAANSSVSNQQKLEALRSELEGSYEEQISRSRAERDALSKQLVSTIQENGFALQTYKQETEAKVKAYQYQHALAQCEMREQILQLQNDQQSLYQLAEKELDEAQAALEREITVLRNTIKDDIRDQSTEVQALRVEHRRMEVYYQQLLLQFQQAQAALVDVQNRVQDAQKRLYLYEDYKLRIERDITERDRSEESKQGILLQMHAEKEDLIKLRALLNYRVGDLKLCIAPKDDQISDLQTQIADMDQELLRDALEQKKSEQKILDLKMKRKTFERENQYTIDKIYYTETQMRELLDDIFAFSNAYAKKMNFKTANQAAFIKQINELKPALSVDKTHHEFVTALKLLYGKHVDERFALSLQTRVSQSSEIVQQITNNQQLKLHYNRNSMSAARQREYLEKSVGTLYISLERRREYLNQAIEQSRQQSSYLLSFSNLMRRENKILQQRLRAAKLDLLKRKKTMNLVETEYFGGALAYILAADEGGSETTSDAVLDEEGSHESSAYQENELEAYLNANFPVYTNAESLPYPPPMLPRPNSRAGLQ